MLRWNSTFFGLRRLIMCKDAVNHVFDTLNMAGYLEPDECGITEREWENVRLLV